MVDRPTGPEPLVLLWREIATHLAVAIGAFTALGSLFFHVPVWVASLRGAIAFFGLVILNHATCAVLVWTRSREAKRDAQSRTARSATSER